VLVVGLVVWDKEGSAPVSALQRFLSSAPLPRRHQWEAQQSSALGGLGFHLAGNKSSWVSLSELGQDLRDVPCA